MILIPFHPGSGVGDQLFCYIAGRITAERLEVPFATVGSFKGAAFIDLDYGAETKIPHHIEWPAGKIIIDNDWPVYEGRSHYDPEFNFIKDNSIVDGCRTQDESYFTDWIGIIDVWLKTKPLYVPEKTCIINFRGGEFTMVPELFLPKSYWDEAIGTMKEWGFTDFQVHTDDPTTAKQFFPDYECIHDVALNWRSVRYANGAIIANSAFGIMPRLLKHYEDSMQDNDAITIAPRGWARYKNREWSTPQSYYSQFQYL